MNTRRLTFCLLLLACAAALPAAWADPDDGLDKVIRIPGVRRVVVLTTEETLAQAAYPGYLAVSGPPPVTLYRQPPTPHPRRASDPAHISADLKKDAQKEKDKAAAVQADADKTAATAPVVAVPMTAAPTDPAASAPTGPAPDVLPTQQATDPHDRTDELLSYFQRQKQAAAAGAAGGANGGYPGSTGGEPEPSFLQPPPSSLAPIAPAPPSRATYHVTE